MNLGHHSVIASVHGPATKCPAHYPRHRPTFSLISTFGTPVLRKMRCTGPCVTLFLCMHCLVRVHVTATYLNKYQLFNVNNIFYCIPTRINCSYGIVHCAIVGDIILLCFYCSIKCRCRAKSNMQWHFRYNYFLNSARLNVSAVRISTGSTHLIIITINHN